MIINHGDEFFVHGHHCEMKNTRREHWEGYVDGQKVTSSHSAGLLRDELINQAKWQVETEPDFWKVCRAVHRFVAHQKDRKTDEYLWVHNDTVINEITPLESVGVAYTALLELENNGFVEQGTICMELNAEQMWRAMDGSYEWDDYPEDNPWEQYKS